MSIFQNINELSGNYLLLDGKVTIYDNTNNNLQTLTVVPVCNNIQYEQNWMNTDGIVTYEDVNNMIDDCNDQPIIPITVINTAKTNRMVVQQTNQLNTVKVNNIDSNSEPCRVCGETKTTGLHFGTVTCEACKKFFLRNAETSNDQLKCTRGSANCVVTKATRTYCPYCRLKKCLSIGMNLKETVKTQSLTALPCQVCSAPSSGIHFGVLSCEGCKGFFRRYTDNETKLHCMANNNCEINTFTRNACRACRLNRCLKAGMSVNNSKIGRQSNLFKTKLFNNEIENPAPTLELSISQQDIRAHEHDFWNNFDQKSRDWIQIITNVYFSNIENVYECQNYYNMSEDQCIKRFIGYMERHAQRCVSFMNTIGAHLCQLPFKHDQIKLICNTIHTIRHLWIHKQNKNINYFNCDDESLTIITQIFPFFNKSNEKLKKLHTNVIKEVNMDNQEYALYSLLTIMTGAYQSNLFNNESNATITKVKFQVSNILAKYMYIRRNELESYHTLMSLIRNYFLINMELQKQLHSKFLQLHHNNPTSNLFKCVYLLNGFSTAFVDII